MAKFFEMGKRKKRLITALSILLSATLSMGIMAACTNTADDPDDDEDKTPSRVDTQLISNGNFEFYSEMDDERDERKAFINTPNDWSFSSGSPSSNTTSGIVNMADWEYMSTSSYRLIPAEDDQVDDPELTSSVISEAKANWEQASLYDRLEFYDYYDIDSASKFELYSDYRYTIDFEDVKYFEEVQNTDKLVHEGAAEDETSVLMIHNHRTSDNVRGTAQYYTSSKTITLQAGTAAKLSVWVRTSELYHYAATTDGENDVAVTAKAGAYIGVTNTVGGTTLDQLQIKNINTQDEWQQYTIYIRANTFASTTFRVVLGLGQGSSDNRYEAVDGYAFFDDVQCEIISGEDFDKEVTAEKYTEGKNWAGLDTKGDARKFLATSNTPGYDDDEKLVPVQNEIYNYALDLSKDFETYTDLDTKRDEVNIGLTEEVSAGKTYTSQSEASLGHDDDPERGNITELLSLSEIKAKSYENGYLKPIYENDFRGKFPFANEDNIILLLSQNGAAYTAKLPTVILQPNERMLVSFFVKTSSIRSGKTGAGAILVDGENKSSITPFDSTTVATVDIDSDIEEKSDIYKGWVQCFFFVQNDTDTEKAFHLELTYGPTALANTTKTDYSAGYAAFANFQTAYLTKAQYSYAATGTYAQKVSLTASVKDSTKFAAAAANGTQLEDGLATPVGYTGVIAGSNVLVNEGQKNPSRDWLAAEYGVYTGLLASEYADNYLALETVNKSVTWGDETKEYDVNAWTNALTKIAGGTTDPSNWWKTIFGNNGKDANMAYQPLVILNTSSVAQPSYGFFASSTTVAANSSSRISMRVKLSAGASAYIYLIDVSDVNVHGKSLQPTLPGVTFWYDDDGNLVNMDPSADDYDENGKILFTLEENGLYKKADDDSDTYYANLSAYGDADDNGNLVTKDGEIAFYGNPDDNAFYAYYDKDTEEYSVKVSDLAKEVPAESVRYTAPANPEDYAAVIRVDGDGSDAWTTVSFYVQTGNEAKNYRLELWAGERTNTEDGIPAGGYVFFDRTYTGSASNFATLRDAEAETIKNELGLDEDDNLPAVHPETGKPLALYYTFTFFDSSSYLRYDATTDEDGNPWKSYAQSNYSEVLSWLYVENDGEAYPTVSLFMSYAQNEVTVTRDVTSSSSSSSSSSSDSGDDAEFSWANFLTLLASIILFVAVVFAVAAMVVRRLIKQNKKTTKSKSKATKRVAPKEDAPASEPAAPETKDDALDENNPYNE